MSFILNTAIVYPLASPREEITSDVIVLIHGLTSAYQTFLNVLQPLADLTNLPVIGIDLRGHGASPESTTGDYTIKSMAADIAKTLFLGSKMKDGEVGALDLSHLKTGRHVHILAHSYGTRAAIQFAADFDFCVKSVIVEDEYIRAENFDEVERKNPPLSEEDTFKRFVEVRDKWVEKFPRSGLFHSEKECSDFLTQVGGEPKRYGFENGSYSRKIGSMKTKNSEDDEGVTWYFPLFKPHVALSFDEYARKADMNFVWKNVEKYSFPIFILCGDGEKNGADVSDADFSILSAEAKMLNEQHAASGKKNNVRIVSKVEGSGHVVHRDFKDEFLKLVGEFIMSQY